MFFKICENSSVGRAPPCQGGGRGFESRFSLGKTLFTAFFYALPLLCKGIGVQARSSGGIGRHVGLKIQWPLGRAGSSPASSTDEQKSQSESFGFFIQQNEPSWIE